MTNVQTKKEGPRTYATPKTNSDANSISNYSELVNRLYAEAVDLSFGTVNLEIHVRDGRPVRAVVSRSLSMMLEGGAV